MGRPPEALKVLPEPHLDEIAVYVVEEAAEWVASTDGGRVLGRYPTEKAAVQAIVTSARRAAR
jgi:hypothetical protein